MEEPPAGDEMSESIVDVVNCSDSTASITTVAETSLDEAVQVQSTSTNMNSGQSKVMNNESTGSLVSVDKTCPHVRVQFTGCCMSSDGCTNKEGN